uniref:Insulin-like domain-containing protein n=1 Tax=Gadus morhua TaxID=8049 RepID=A0A8C5F381_GADMO
MLLRVAVAAVLVLVCVCSGAANGLLVPRDYGVKLCGREFIRAVIFTCGGSRWKRSLDDHLGEFSFINWQNNYAKVIEVVPYPHPPPSFSDTLADLLAAFGRDRNFSLGVAGMCCNLGCTKNDIGHLC